jgi:putative membrane protein
MILRDHLAYDRTVLAHERTLLSYLRTSIALLAAGGTLVKLFPDEAALVRLGTVLLVLGGAAAIIGIWRFVAVRAKLSITYKPLDEGGKSSE